MHKAISEAVQQRIDSLEAEAEKKRQEKAVQRWLVVYRFAYEILDRETNQPRIVSAFGWTFLQKLKEAPERCTNGIPPEKKNAKIVAIWACDWKQNEPDCDPFLFFGEEDPSDRVARSLLFNFRQEALKEQKGVKNDDAKGTTATTSNKKKGKNKPHIRYVPPTTPAPTKAEAQTYYGPYSLIEAPKAK